MGKKRHRAQWIEGRVVMQRLLSLLLWLIPARLYGAAMRSAATCQKRWWKNAMIAFWRKSFTVHLDEALVTDPEGYVDFSSFFTRALHPDARTIDAGTDALVSPADGVLLDAGIVRDNTLIQAKRHRYSLAQFIDQKVSSAERFVGGAFFTIYLAPGDYHRVHMPCDATITGMTYVPGRLYPVKPWLLRRVPDILAANERLILFLDTDAGKMVLVLVGALGVGALSTVWHGQIAPSRAQRPHTWDYRHTAAVMRFAKGDEIARFGMGSTVVLITDEDCDVTVLPQWYNAVSEEDDDDESVIRVGQRLGTVVIDTNGDDEAST